jgi:hypothetical protein
MIKDHFIKAKLRFQRGVGHVSYITAVISVYTALKVSITSFPTEVYIAIIPCYLIIMWAIGYLDERLGWSVRETSIQRGMTDPVLLKIASDVEEINKRISENESKCKTPKIVVLGDPL